MAYEPSKNVQKDPYEILKREQKFRTYEQADEMIKLLIKFEAIKNSLEKTTIKSMDLQFLEGSINNLRKTIEDIKKYNKLSKSEML